MRIAITGPTGHVGAVLVRELLASGNQVRALVYEETPALDGLEVEKVSGNVLDAGSLEAAFEGAEWVFHLAAVIVIDKDPKGLAQRVNVGGTRNVVEACLKCGVRRLVHFSSIHALSAEPVEAPVDETRPLCDSPNAPAYDRSKADAERAVLQAVNERGLDSVIVNPTGIVGPMDFARSHMGRMLLDMYHRRIPALVDGGFNWVDVRDVARGAAAAAAKGRCGERYLLGGNYHSVRSVGDIVAQVTGVSRPRVVLPMQLARCLLPLAAMAAAVQKKPTPFTSASLYALRNHQEVNCGKAARELGYVARPFEESMEDTFAWYSEQGWLNAR